MRFGIAASVVIFSLTCGAAHADALKSRVVPASATLKNTDASWKAISTLGGIWGIAEDDPGYDKNFRISLQAISNGTALVETFGDPAQRVTQTIYHRDGNNIMATHYCAQGNQPRLILTPPVTLSEKLVFSFLDITNLASKNHSHLVRLEFKILDGNRIERIETYRQGNEREVSGLKLVRLQ